MEAAVAKVVSEAGDLEVTEESEEGGMAACRAVAKEVAVRKVEREGVRLEAARVAVRVGVRVVAVTVPHMPSLVRLVLAGR